MHLNGSTFQSEKAWRSAVWECWTLADSPFLSQSANAQPSEAPSAAKKYHTNDLSQAVNHDVTVPYYQPRRHASVCMSVLPNRWPSHCLWPNTFAASVATHRWANGLQHSYLSCHARVQWSEDSKQIKPVQERWGKLTARLPVQGELWQMETAQSKSHDIQDCQPAVRNDTWHVAPPNSAEGGVPLNLWLHRRRICHLIHLVRATIWLSDLQVGSYHQFLSTTLSSAAGWIWQEHLWSLCGKCQTCYSMLSSALRMHHDQSLLPCLCKLFCQKLNLRKAGDRNTTLLVDLPVNLPQTKS